jgi:hypothetical protein
VARPIRSLPGYDAALSRRYARRRPRGRARLERQEQVELVALLQTQHPDVLFFAIPNGGARDKRVASRLKAEGVLAGVCDLFVAEPRGGYPGLFVEMKRTTGGTVSPKQRRFMRRARARGYKVEVCDRGARAALEVVEAYLAEPGGPMLSRLRRALE